jgi:hypothetical protein
VSSMNGGAGDGGEVAGRREMDVNILIPEI